MFLFPLYSILFHVILSTSYLFGGDSSFIQKQTIFVEEGECFFFENDGLDENEHLEIQFASLNGRATWISNDQKPLKICGTVSCNGFLEIQSSSGIVLADTASLTSVGVKLLSEKKIKSRGCIFTHGENVYLISPIIKLLDDARIDASGPYQGGSVYVGGGFRGQCDELPNSLEIRIEPGVKIHSDAKIAGRSGDVVVWSNESTVFLGSISATGVDAGGDVEVSSASHLFFDGTVDVSSKKGVHGSLLIDPATITIQASNPDIDGLALGNDITTANELSNPLTFPGVNSIITSGALNALLTGGVSMTLSATNSITVNSPISAAGVVNTLTLNAPSLFLNQPITLPFGGSINGTASIVNVGPSGIIQNGVDAVSSGGVVNLAVATYVQEVYIGKNLTLNGSGVNNTSIVCPTTPSPLTNTFVFTINGATYHPMVLAEGASNILIQNLTVDGNSQASNFLNFRFVGIGYHNAGGIVQNTKITNVEDSFPGGGTQHGFGILGAIDTGAYTIQVLNNVVDRFQKQGITMRGPTLTTIISGNTVTAETPVSLATVNGIVIQNGTTATISNNIVNDILSATSGVDSVGILLFAAGANSTVSNNSINNGNIGIYSINTGNNLNISSNTIDVMTSIGVYVQDTLGLTTITGNVISCNMAASNSLGVSVENPDTGAPMGHVFVGSTPSYNMYLVSVTNQPFQLSSNTFNPCDIGLGVEGTTLFGPLVSMNHDVFVGEPTYYIQLINEPNNIWPSTDTVSFNGLVSGYITYEQYLDIQSRLFGNFQDSGIGVILEYLQPFNPAPPIDFVGEVKKDMLLNKTEYCLRAIWTASTSPNVIAYRIYFGNQFVQQVSASASLVFKTSLKHKKNAYLYSITALNNLDLESTSTPIQVIND